MAYALVCKSCGVQYSATVFGFPSGPSETLRRNSIDSFVQNPHSFLRVKESRRVSPPLSTSRGRIRFTQKTGAFSGLFLSGNTVCNASHNVNVYTGTSRNQTRHYKRTLSEWDEAASFEQRQSRWNRDDHCHQFEWQKVAFTNRYSSRRFHSRHLRKQLKRKVDGKSQPLSSPLKNLRIKPFEQFLINETFMSGPSSNDNVSHSPSTYSRIVRNQRFDSSINTYIKQRSSWVCT